MKKMGMRKDGVPKYSAPDGYGSSGTVKETSARTFGGSYPAKPNLSKKGGK